MKRAALKEGLRLVFQDITRLKEAFPNRAFTIDGRLIGDVGQEIAALQYDVVLHDVSQPITTPRHPMGATCRSRGRSRTH